MSWNKNQITDLLEEAAAIAQRTKRDLRCELKTDRSLVTQADKDIEALFSRSLEDPADGRYIIGEETIHKKGESYIEDAFREECYVVDPIDGTAPYAHLLPVWGISVGRMEAGVLTDGAVYLPDMGEMVLSDGDDVLAGVRTRNGWQWGVVEDPPDRVEGYGLLAVTQSVAKRGRVTLPNPVLVLGTAVVPMLGLLHGRFIGYLGSVRLWDVAGALPLLLRKGFSVTVRVGDEIRSVTSRVEDRTYHIGSDSKRRWALRNDLLVCLPQDEERFRVSFTSGES